jgi:hypothetical protein
MKTICTIVAGVLSWGAGKRRTCSSGFSSTVKPIAYVALLLCKRIRQFHLAKASVEKIPVERLHSQSQTFNESQITAVQQIRYRMRLAGQEREYSPSFVDHKYDR